MTDLTGFYFLLFTYGFIFVTHLMGWQKHYTLNDFSWSKALTGLVNEFGFVLFLLLVYLVPQYVDASLLGVDLNEIVDVVLILPLGQSILIAYSRAKELRDIDVNESDKDTLESNGDKEGV